MKWAARFNEQVYIYHKQEMSEFFIDKRKKPVHSHNRLTKEGGMGVHQFLSLMTSVATLSATTKSAVQGHKQDMPLSQPTMS